MTHSSHYYRPHQQRRFGAMRTQIHIVVTGSSAEVLLESGVALIGDLEARWSRFLPTSEISRLNSAVGHPQAVSSETFDLIEKAVASWVLTDGRFDPTMLRSLEELGYDRSFEHLGEERAHVRAPQPSGQCGSIVMDAADFTVRLPAGVSFDPGGIGKGLAADLICQRLMDLGADGVMVNAGGDLKTQGDSPLGDCWAVDIREPALRHQIITTVNLTNGALATSTTLKRVWRGPEGQRHHLLDPSTGQSHKGGPVLASVVAGEAWWAEVAATSLIGAPANRDLPTAPKGSSALIVTDDGSMHRLGEFDRFELPRPHSALSYSQMGTQT